ncbi:MAG TPA: hemerythrin domain-containing protein [Rhodanobacteraceae bacterium]|nr:hemerythrin domain-containing protein [Rhodanobacteraceae bacterium]
MRDCAGKILYDPRLLDSLLSDHVELGRLFGRIGDAGNAGEARELRSLLVTFKARLKAHLVVENMRFYDYLEQSLADEPETARMVLNYRRKMTRIASDVFDFIQKYQSSRLTPKERRQFTPDYEMVGAELEQRLDSEEDNLYRLYRPR